MKIIFNNGTELEYTFALESKEFYKNAQRECIAFKCDSTTISLDALNAILSNEANLETITLIGEVDGKEVREILSNYVIKMELTLKPEIIEAETSDATKEFDRLALISEDIIRHLIVRVDE